MTRYIVLAAAGLIAGCGHAAQQQTEARPDRGVRSLTATDADFIPISVVAAQSLPSTVGVTTMFGGVIIDGRNVRPASEAVIRATGFTFADQANATKQPFVVCKVAPVGLPQGVHAQG